MQTIKEGFFDEKNVPIENKNPIDQKLIGNFLMLDQKVNSLKSIDWFDFLWEQKLFKINCNIYPQEYLSYDICKICHHKNVSKTINFVYDNKLFIFPSIYLHYVRYHNIIPSQSFLNMLGKLKDSDIILPVVNKERAEQARFLCMIDGSNALKYSK